MHLLLEKRSREVKMERRKAIVQAESMRSELQKYQVMLSELIDSCNTALLAENMGIASSLLSDWRTKGERDDSKLHRPGEEEPSFLLCWIRYCLTQPTSPD